MPTKSGQRRQRSSGDPTQFQNEDEAYGLHRDDGAEQDHRGPGKMTTARRAAAPKSRRAKHHR